ncbi:MAG TPA: hypothetical protein PKE62_03640 [Anaerolineales bacterium]|nr:hypothetical protein [Anaerolineales bacterium]
MNKLLIAHSITIILLLSSCLSFNQAALTQDNVVLQTFFKNHPPPVFSANDEPPPPGMTFEEFFKNLIYVREDVDINNDGAQEILLSGSTGLPNWAFFVIYKSNNKQELDELYYSEAVSWRLASVQFKVDLPYIFADFLTTSGGTGYSSYYAERNIVRCTESNCASIPYRYFSGTTGGDYHSSSADTSEDQVEIKVNGLYVASESVSEIVCDPTGKEYSLDKEQSRYYVDTSHYYKYLWKDNHFLETEYQATPAFEVSGFFDGNYTGVIPALIRESIGTEATIQQTLDAYFDFFDATVDERKNSPVIPCNQVNKDSNWLPYSIPTTIYQEMQDQDYFAAVNNMCRLVVWKKNSDIFYPTLNDLEIIGRDGLADCNPDFISFQWMNITGSDIPELIITSGISKQTIWIYDVDQSVKLLHQTTGFARENPLVGVQLQKINDDITLQVGLPRSNGQCLNAFNCFLLDKEFEAFRWNNETQTFVPVP